MLAYFHFLRNKIAVYCCFCIVAEDDSDTSSSSNSREESLLDTPESNPAHIVRADTPYPSSVSSSPVSITFTIGS